MNALGRIPVSVNGVVAPAVRQVQFDKTKVQKVHKFADGSRARSEGQADFKFSLTCSLLSDKQLLINMIDAAITAGEEVNISYELGSEEYMFVNCGLDNEGASSDQDGTADLALSGVAEDRLKVR